MDALANIGRVENSIGFYMALVFAGLVVCVGLATMYNNSKSKKKVAGHAGVVLTGFGVLIALFAIISHHVVQTNPTAATFAGFANVAKLV